MTVSIQSGFPATKKLHWTNWLKEGEQYLNAATPKGARSKFKEDVRYNLLAMAFESFAMAIADFSKALPYNHTFTDLIDALEPLVDLPPDIKATILSCEDTQSICSIDEYHRDLPSTAALNDLHQAVTRIKKIAQEHCSS